MVESQKAHKVIKPDTNRVQISSKKDAGFYVFISKLFLLDFEEIELHGLGDAITTCVKVADTLTRYGYTQYKKIETTTLQPEKEEKAGPRRGKKAKLIVTLRKGKDFKELMKNFKIDNPAGKK
mmetsp:Transcript_12759/g.14648  ORF Transcript_12759/g.14648 Transcript_12759/m.14648 type:complete len:123 (-) Transcript_12759:211-579(-)|eukprot:CAMPEP_0176424910 /NCGR_PEP_ID=MMETSP0127-20121128/11100_1 /TAXON_ID=938130 /ORGANISM="Platyophrya macrostoma, Strain WH" /LENGTH=122 /DNA_ID=CAMNT_0017806021 /DNA_START=93 /DNA_END=461 /DNA_ORIENTATION=+